MRTLLLFLLGLNLFSAQAQLDTQHWLAPLHSRSTSQIQDHYVYLSTPETTPFTVTITNGAGTVLATPVISAGNPFIYAVGNGQIPATPLFVPIDSLNQPMQNCGLKLTASFPFYTNQRMRSNAQAESITSKGTAALGTTFRIGGFPQFFDGASGDRNFVAGIMATQNNTQVTISNYNPAVVFTGPSAFSAPSITVTLQAGETYVVSGNNDVAANMDGFIGALIESTQPIVLTNGNILGNIHPTSSSRDMGADQTVPVERLGKDYILIEGNGIPEMERPIVIAHSNNTKIYINGASAPVATIQAGDYYLVSNSDYQGSPHRNMHIHTSEPAYIYQALAGSASAATSGLNFIPPYNCFLPQEINFIPDVEKIGATTYTGGLMIFTRQGATLQINGVTQTGEVSVPGIPWVTYKVLGLTGNVSITSTSPVAAGVFGASSNAGFAGYYSGFSTNPNASEFTYADTCINTTAQFTGSFDTEVPVDSVSWNFDDPSTGLANSSSILNPSHTFSAPGTYTVRFITYRCENDTVIKSVTILGLPSIADAGPDQTFCSSSVTLAGNVPVSGTGMWTLTTGTGTIVNPTLPNTGVTGMQQGPNIFQWTIYNACGSLSDEVQINNYISPVADAGPDLTVCSGTVALGANPTYNGLGQWSVLSGSGTVSVPTSPNTIITGLLAGTTVLQWEIDNSPCPLVSDQLTLIRVTNTTANAGVDQTVCGDAVTLAANAGGTGSWSVISGNGVFADAFSPTTTVSGLSTGSNVFLWTVTNDPCDPTSDAVSITRIAPAAAASAGTDQSVCSDQAQLNAGSPTAGTGVWTLVSGTGTIDTPSSPSSTISGLGTGTSVFEWTVTNSPCPSSSDQVSIIRVALPAPANAGTDQSFCSNQVQLNASSPTSGTGIWTLISGTGTIDTPSSPSTTISGLGTGTSVFQWTVTNSPCPSSSDQVSIAFSAPVLLPGSISPDYCSQGNGIATVQGSGFFGNPTFTWTPGNLTGPSQSGLTTGVYNVLLTDANNCTAQISITIPAGSAMQAEAGDDIALCEGLPVILNASGSALYSWQPSAQNGIPFIPSEGGTYVVTATDIHGCITKDSLNITIMPIPEADFSILQNPSFINTEVLFDNQSTDGTHFYWEFGNGMYNTITLPEDVTSTYTLPGTYEVVLIAYNQQCSDTAKKTLVILPYNDPVVSFPNVFSPNGDNVNDVFSVKCEQCADVQITIVNRWGETVGEIGGEVQEWDGNGNTDGVYFYIYNVTGLNGTELSGQGNVTLIRN